MPAQINQSAFGLNQAIDSKIRDRDSTRKKSHNSDKYAVTLKDEKGNDYTINYLFNN